MGVREWICGRAGGEGDPGGRFVVSRRSRELVSFARSLATLGGCRVAHGVTSVVHCSDEISWKEQVHKKKSSIVSWRKYRDVVCT